MNCISEAPAQRVQDQGDDAKDGEAIYALVATVACIAQDVGVGIRFGIDFRLVLAAPRLDILPSLKEGDSYEGS